MAVLTEELALQRCPHCRIASPRLTRVWSTETKTSSGAAGGYWAAYSCISCGGVALGRARGPQGDATQIWPETVEFDEAIPERARDFLRQAADSMAAPAGAVMLCASAIDSMLKAKSLTKGTLNDRIKEAESQHLITPEMAQWAHDVRLDANDQRHADDSAPLPGQADAQKCMEFALALGTFLFVLPARVQRGIAAAKTPGTI